MSDALKNFSTKETPQALKSPQLVITKRRCARCKQYKDLNDENFRFRATKGWYEAFCRNCEKEYQAEYYQKNRTRILARESRRSGQRWAKIKADAILHASYLEDVRINRRLKREVRYDRRGVIGQPEHFLLVDSEPLVRFIVEKQIAIYALARKAQISERTIRRFMYENKTRRVSFYIADQICIAFEKSVYDLYPEMRE